MKKTNDLITSAELKSVLDELESEWAQMDADWDVKLKEHMAFRDNIRKRFNDLIAMMRRVESFSCDDDAPIVSEDFRSETVANDDVIRAIKPVTVHFVNDGSSEQYQRFGTWHGYVVQVCRMIVRHYGLDALKKAVFDTSDASLPWSRCEIFILFTDDLDVSSYTLIGGNVCLLRQYGSGNCRQIVSALENLFPEVKSQLIYA